MSAETAPPASERTASTAPFANASLALPLIKDIGHWLYGLAVAALYVCGFLVLNSHLAKHGVFDFEFVDARYFLAGATFAFYLVCFYLFGGRAILFTPRWLGQALQRMNSDGRKPFWSFVLFVHSILTLVFFCCLSAGLFTSIAISRAETTAFYAALGGAFFLKYTLDITNLDLKFPRASQAIMILAELGATYGFFFYSGTGAMRSVFFSYLAICIFINFVLDVFRRYKRTADQVTFNGLYAVVFLISSAISFGGLFYGEITPRLGGARPQAVSLIVSDDVRHALPLAVPSMGNQGLEGNLIHQTQSHVYVETSGRTVRLRSADVIALVITPAEDDPFRKQDLEQTTNDKKSAKLSEQKPPSAKEH
jgi:hypothetical protein